MNEEVAALAAMARDRFTYDPGTGELRWRRARGCAVAGHVSARDGYRRVYLGGRLLLAHRVVWLMTHGRWPNEHLDHINGVGHDNRLDNLREATRSENLWNAKCRADSSSGVKGVYWHAQMGKWCARITANGRVMSLGLFESIEDAAAARAKAAEELHGQFARIA